MFPSVALLAFWKKNKTKQNDRMLHLILTKWVDGGLGFPSYNTFFNDVKIN